MCYTSPGPRCSSHAGQTLLKAKQAYELASATNNFASYGSARDRYQEAKENYRITPAGIRALQRKVYAETGPEGVEALRELNRATADRTTALRAYKKAFEKGEASYPLLPEDEHFLKTIDTEADQAKLEETKAGIRTRAEEASRQGVSSTVGGHLFERHQQISHLETQIADIRKQQDGLLEMRKAATSPAEKRDIHTIGRRIQDKANRLQYELELVRTKPKAGDHPQTVEDRETVLKQFALMDSIEGVLSK